MTTSASHPLVLAVVGPTGAGKSAVGVALAERLGGEVVNADSMQLYRGMDVGTAKLPVDERRGVPHHLLDVLDVAETADVSRYQQDARAVVDALLDAGRVPVLVGGSGLYVRAVLDDLQFPGTDPAARAALEVELAERGPAPLHARLAAVDPAAAAAILPGNGRRIVRALEVVGLRGSFTASLPEPRPLYPALQVALDRTDLDRRLARRTREMFAAGFVDEVCRLEAAGLREGRTASRALGYVQILQALDDGAAGAPADERLARAEAETLAATRRFARRQRSWFRRDPAVRWLTDGRPDPTKAPATATAQDEQREDLVGAAVVTTIQNWWNLARRGTNNL